MPVDPVRLKDVFAEALVRVDPADRAAYLAAACGEDAALRARVEALLRASEQPDSLLDDPLPHAPGNAPADTTRSFGDPDGTRSRPGPAEAEGAVIGGRYKLRQRIGEGGMGTVWMADQTEPVKRKVAVKLIRVERGQSKTILARFEAERQAIALMDHPHIAKLLDAGTTDTGSPFFVMELVKGVPLTDFCDQHKLTIADRLNLFQQICSAVQHAHQKGVIHRDLKPSNILVESHDGKPVPKVIDFGLAKATTGLQLTDQSMFTAFGSVMGTPLYMAPEQATFNAVDVDTRADVYALGVILYELLTGTTPLTKETVKKAALDEMLRLIREQEPPTPSSRLSAADRAPSVAANRQIEPLKLGRFVKGELDWIVLKALSKDRDRRYETANGFARDIERFLNHEPVTAGPPSARYRLQKFVQRNKGQVIAASVVFLALVAGIVGTSLGLGEARRQQAIAEMAADEERQAKQREAERADGERLANQQAQRRLGQIEKGNAVLNSIFKDLDIREVKDRKQPLEAVLAKRLVEAAAQVEGDAIGDPLVVAGIQTGLGSTLVNLGFVAEGVGLYEKALTTRQALLPADDPLTLLSMTNLGTVYLAVGKHKQAVPLLEEALKRHLANPEADPARTTHYRFNLANGYKDAGRFDRAVPLYEEVIRNRRAEGGDDHRDTPMHLNNLADCYREMGKYDLAIPLLEEALKRLDKVLGPDHRDTLVSRNNLAICYEGDNKLVEAMKMLEETRRLLQAKLGADHPDTLACMCNLGELYRLNNLPEQALQILLEARKGFLAKLGAKHPLTATTTGNLANAYRALDKVDLAIPLYEEAVTSLKANYPDDHPSLVTARSNLAGCYKQVGQLDKMAPLLVENLPHIRSAYGREHPLSVNCMADLAQAYWRAKQLDKSVPMYEETLAIEEKRLGRQHERVQTLVANLGVNYKDAGRVTEALPLLEEGYRASKRFPRISWAGQQLLDAYSKAGQPAEAAKLIDELLADVRNTLPKESPQLAGQLAQFGKTLLDLKGYAEAEPLHREALTIREKTQPDAWTTFNTQSLLGGALLGQKKYADAEPLLVKGYEGMKAREKTIPPQGATRIPEALDRLVELYTATGKPDEVKKYQDLRAKYPTLKETLPPPRADK